MYMARARAGLETNFLFAGLLQSSKALFSTYSVPFVTNLEFQSKTRLADTQNYDKLQRAPVNMDGVDACSHSV